MGYLSNEQLQRQMRGQKVRMMMYFLRKLKETPRRTALYLPCMKIRTPDPAKSMVKTACHAAGI
jgi:hypothetical protein